MANNTEWGYGENNGPATWPLLFPDAAGSRQSPINIDTALATSDDSLKTAPLSWKYVPENCLSITNTGYGWRLDVDGTGSELTGGPLDNKYKLEQFHCHWGCHNTEGSEHTVDHKSYAGELHLVHWNYHKYATFKEACANPDGLAVLGILLEAGSDDHPEIEKIVSLLPKITLKNQNLKIHYPIDPSKLLPEDTLSYWTYLGSLTTPPCLESVIWILFKKPVYISEKQLNVFRSLKTCHADNGQTEHLLQNYRPPMPLGNRVLRQCGSV